MNDLKSYLGKEVYIVIDRPLGSTHPNHSDILYTVNYGYIPDTVSGDGEELDIYLLGVSVPVRDFVGEVIAIIHRFNDNEDKLVVAPEGVKFSKEEIEELTRFQEKFFDIEIITEEG